MVFDFFSIFDIFPRGTVGSRACQSMNIHSRASLGKDDQSMVCYMGSSRVEANGMAALDKATVDKAVVDMTGMLVDIAVVDSAGMVVDNIS